MCIFVPYLICLTAVGLSGLEWPVQEFKPTHFFGQRSEQGMETGLILENSGTVRASADGTVLLRLEENTNMSGFPNALGNTVILTHDDGLLTVYGNLDSIDRVSEASHVELSSILGKTGSSGWGNPTDCIFQVIDQTKKTILNPLMLLPGFKDRHAPNIRNVVLVSQNGQTIAPGSVDAVRQGTYRLYADICDTIDNASTELSPFRITVLINGKEHTLIPFEQMKESDGKLYLSSPAFTRDTFFSDPTRIFLGEISLIRGQADISLMVKDTAGNERSVLFGLQID